MLRSAIKLLIVVAAVGGPILYYKAPNIWNSAKETCSNLFNGSGKEKAKTPDVNINTPPELTPLGTPKVPVHEGVVTDFAEVFRFDISSGWIMNRWPRVSTGLSQPQFQGYRVPLVTGTRLDDVAGSLTYYFNPYQQVQTITFNGTTGDATRLIQMMSQKYGFQRQLTKDGGLFVYIVPDKKEKVQSIMRIRPAGIIRADAPHSRFQVDIILQRPNNEKVANNQPASNWQK